MAAVNTKVSVWATSTSVITKSFRAVILTNYGTSGIIWLRVGQSWDAVVWEGIPLNPWTSTAVGGSFAMNDDSLFQSPITAISSTWTNLLSVYYV